VSHPNTGGSGGSFGGSGPNDLYAVGPGNLVSHWDGTTWSDVPITGFNSPTGVAASAPNDVFLVNYDCGMMHFDGTRWSPVRAGARSGCQGLEYSNGAFWSVALAPAMALTGLVRAKSW
jgi:hypothetical protein